MAKDNSLRKQSFKQFGEVAKQVNRSIYDDIQFSVLSLLEIIRISANFHEVGKLASSNYALKIWTKNRALFHSQRFDYFTINVIKSGRFSIINLPNLGAPTLFAEMCLIGKLIWQKLSTYFVTFLSFFSYYWNRAEEIKHTTSNA